MLSGARMQISEIAKELGISEKTTTRNLARMKEQRILEFSLQCDPASMIGYIQFVIRIGVEKCHYRDVYERMYLEFKERARRRLISSFSTRESTVRKLK